MPKNRTSSGPKKIVRKPKKNKTCEEGYIDDLEKIGPDAFVDHGPQGPPNSPKQDTYLEL